MVNTTKCKIVFSLLQKNHNERGKKRKKEGKRGNKREKEEVRFALFIPLLPS